MLWSKYLDSILVSALDVHLHVEFCTIDASSKHNDFIVLVQFWSSVFIWGPVVRKPVIILNNKSFKKEKINKILKQKSLFIVSIH